MNRQIMASQAGSPEAPATQGSSNVVFIIDPWFDSSYVKSIPGMMKVAVIILNLLGFICIQSTAFWSNGRGVYFNIIAHLGLWFSLVILLCYTFHVVEKYHNIKWLKIEMIVYGGLTFLNLIAATIAVAYGSPGYSAAGFFSYLAMVIYGYEAYLKAKALQAGDVAQGRRVNVKPTHVVTPPAMT